MPNILKHALTNEDKKIISQALWDMNLTPEEFLDIIEGKSERKWPERGFCVARVLESVSWFDIVKITEIKWVIPVPHQMIKQSMTAISLAIVEGTLE